MGCPDILAVQPSTDRGPSEGVNLFREQNLKGVWREDGTANTDNFIFLLKKQNGKKKCEKYSQGLLLLGVGGDTKVVWDV
jgi:hypothetical protein